MVTNNTGVGTADCCAQVYSSDSGNSAQGRSPRLTRSCTTAAESTVTCVLSTDGDSTELGERGINLSGGQVASMHMYGIDLMYGGAESTVMPGESLLYKGAADFAR